MTAQEDGAVTRRRWDDACAAADRAVRDARAAAAQTPGDAHVARWLTTVLGELAGLQAAVDARRRRPGPGATGLLRDFPVDLQLPAYAPALAALEEVARLLAHGLDAPGWDWDRGFPPGWPTTVKDRVRAVLPWRPA